MLKHSSAQQEEILPFIKRIHALVEPFFYISHINTSAEPAWQQNVPPASEAINANKSLTDVSVHAAVPLHTSAPTPPLEVREVPVADNSST